MIWCVGSWLDVLKLSTGCMRLEREAQADWGPIYIPKRMPVGGATWSCQKLPQHHLPHIPSVAVHPLLSEDHSCLTSSLRCAACVTPPQLHSNLQEVKIKVELAICSNTFTHPVNLLQVIINMIFSLSQLFGALLTISHHILCLIHLIYTFS